MAAALPDYAIPEGLYAVPDHLLDLRPDSEIDHDLLNPRPVSDEKNVWLFWHSGFAHMHPYTQRTVRASHRRFSKQGWVFRVLDSEPNSPMNVANFLNVHDLNTFPQAFIDGTLGGSYAAQHTSDLVRFPLLLKYGGVYTDVGVMQIGDLDRLWNETIGNPASPYEVISYGADLTNYFLASNRNNAFFARCHKLLLELWAEDGGKKGTEGMHKSPLMKGVPMMGKTLGITIEEDGKTIGPEEISIMLTDYIIQGQVIVMVMGLVDEEDGWNGPKYAAESVYAINFMEGSQMINHMAGWDGPKHFKLMSLSLPAEGEEESADQRQAREIVEACMQKSFGFKLATGFILRVMGDTLASLWRKNVGSDDVPGTYAQWLRHGTMYWNQKHIPPTIDLKDIRVIKKGPLLRET